MIWYWLGMLKLVWRWLVEPPVLATRIDPKAACPVCGGEGRGITAMVVQQTNAGAVLTVRHDCAVCGAKWFEAPISKDMQPGSVWPADGTWPTGVLPSGQRNVRVIHGMQ